MIKDFIAKIGQSRIRKCLTSALHRLGVRLARECPLIAFLRGFGVDEVRDFPDARFWTSWLICCSLRLWLERLLPVGRNRAYRVVSLIEIPLAAIATETALESKCRVRPLLWGDANLQSP
jgi:hypothetical protein